ncbi:MAG: AzlC family ABC transporter permease [Coriobacteriaceae bacterium]|nr:AzlC family ABC transporter permease [Coriobacteriaceae bacterium]
MLSRNEVIDALKTAFPIMAGYVGIGLPCGIMEQQIGLDALQAFLVSCLFYSGAGQFMIPGMWIGGAPMAAVIASVSAVNTRQILYSASLSKYCQNVGKRLSFLYSGTVTDETFGVNVQRFESGPWKVSQALLVNLFSCSCWALANAVGVLLGEMVSIPVAVGSFAMTAIFICLLCGQQFTRVNVVVIIVSFAGVIACKAIGVTGPAIIIGALLGVVAGILYLRRGDEA